MIVNAELSRFSRYGGFGADVGSVRFELWPGAGVGFNEEWARDNWLGGKWLEHIRFWKVADYEPISDAVLNRAIQKQSDYATAIEMGNVEAETEYAKYISELKRLTKAVDQSIKNDFTGLGTASDTGHRKHAQSLTSLNRAIARFANSKVPVSAVETAPVSPGTRTDKSTVRPAEPTYVPVSAGKTTSALSTTGGGTRPSSMAPVSKPGLPGWVMPVGIGAGALLLGGITFAIVRKKSKK